MSSEGVALASDLPVKRVEQGHGEHGEHNQTCDQQERRLLEQCTVSVVLLEGASASLPAGAESHNEAVSPVKEEGNLAEVVNVVQQTCQVVPIDEPGGNGNNDLDNLDVETHDEEQVQACCDVDSAHGAVHFAVLVGQLVNGVIAGAGVAGAIVVGVPEGKEAKGGGPEARGENEVVGEATSLGGNDQHFWIYIITQTSG